MKKISDNEMLDKLTTVEAWKAFNRVSGLNTTWEIDDERETKYLRLVNVAVKKEGAFYFQRLKNGFGDSFDDAIVAYDNRLVRRAQQKGSIVIVNPEGGFDRKEYKYDQSTQSFVAYKP